MNLQSGTDPEMGQELYALGCMLQPNADSMTTRDGRLILMDGSDSDDEDQHSRGSVQKEAES